MNAATKRSILRWVHIVFGLTLIGFVYGPPAETEPYRYMFQYVFMPAILISGFWLWKGDALLRLFSKRTA